MCGVLAILAVPIGIALARETEQVTLVNSSGSIAIGALLGFSAILLARRAQDRVKVTLGRVGGGGTARIGRLLGLAGLLVCGTAALALGFYGLLVLFAG